MDVVYRCYPGTNGLRGNPSTHLLSDRIRAGQEMLFNYLDGGQSQGFIAELVFRFPVCNWAIYKQFKYDEQMKLRLELGGIDYPVEECKFSPGRISLPGGIAYVCEYTAPGCKVLERQVRPDGSIPYCVDTSLCFLAQRPQGIIILLRQLWPELQAAEWGGEPIASNIVVQLYKDLFLHNRKFEVMSIYTVLKRMLFMNSTLYIGASTGNETGETIDERLAVDCIRHDGANVLVGPAVMPSNWQDADSQTVKRLVYRFKGERPLGTGQNTYVIKYRGLLGGNRVGMFQTTSPRHHRNLHHDSVNSLLDSIKRANETLTYLTIVLAFALKDCSRVVEPTSGHWVQNLPRPKTAVLYDETSSSSRPIPYQTFNTNDFVVGGYVRDGQCRISLSSLCGMPKGRLALWVLWLRTVYLNQEAINSGWREGRLKPWEINMIRKFESCQPPFTPIEWLIAPIFSSPANMLHDAWEITRGRSIAAEATIMMMSRLNSEDGSIS